ncbi:hypothetical protein GPA19_08130 [Azoarcus indigens]|uniref:Uncharacterized protein n=1 Tax=Azoarcus indigens TaxID=29545 RepID=A0A4R6E0E2_9RHOO|nr:hypothetical protein [Azoarcus indigens]NMG64912.1 hypothetical protein [Azoarcus indigens]TDN50449.1 hypothetical protein C7389_109143 [Azoarcus indigens]
MATPLSPRQRLERMRQTASYVYDRALQDMRTCIAHGVDAEYHRGAMNALWMLDIIDDIQRRAFVNELAFLACRRLQRRAEGLPV